MQCLSELRSKRGTYHIEGGIYLKGDLQSPSRHFQSRLNARRVPGMSYLVAAVWYLAEGSHVCSRTDWWRTQSRPKRSAAATELLYGVRARPTSTGDADRLCSPAAPADVLSVLSLTVPHILRLGLQWARGTVEA